MVALAPLSDPLRRWNAKLALVTGGMLAAVLLGATALPSGCLSQTLFGLPCPGCGLTGSVLATLHGDLGSAFDLHPLGPAVAAAFLLLFLWSAARAVFPSTSAAASQRAARQYRGFDRLLLLSLTAAWLIGLAA